MRARQTGNEEEMKLEQVYRRRIITTQRQLSFPFQTDFLPLFISLFYLTGMPNENIFSQISNLNLYEIRFYILVLASLSCYVCAAWSLLSKNFFLSAHPSFFRMQSKSIRRPRNERSYRRRKSCCFLLFSVAAVHLLLFQEPSFVLRKYGLRRFPFSKVLL